MADLQQSKRTATFAELEQWCAEGKTAKQIGEILGRDKTSVAKALGILGLHRKIKGPYQRKGAREAARRHADDHCATALVEFAKGKTLTDIARELELSPVYLHRWLKKRGLPTTPAAWLRVRAAATKSA